jgi:polyribonucleotide nucleotidyltransferase
VRVGRVEGQFVVMPTFEQLDESDMDIVVAGTADNIIMVEGGTREVPEADMITALEFARVHPEITDLIHDPMTCGGEAAAGPPPTPASLTR